MRRIRSSQPNLDLGFRPPHGYSINGGAQDISVAFGAGFDDNRGNIMAYATYRKQDSVLQATRDYSFCAMGTNYAEDVPEYGPFYCGGSTTSAQGRLRVFDPATGARLFNGHLNAPAHTLVPGVPLFNFAPYNYYQRPTSATPSARLLSMRSARARSRTSKRCS
jgi:hypothetical protein